MFAGTSQHFANGIVHAKQPALFVRFGNADGCSFVGRRQTLFALASRALGFVKARHIGGETARIDEFAVVETAVRGYKHMLGRTVLGPEASWITIKLLTAREPVKNISDDRRIRMKLRDGPSDILVSAIAKQGQFCLVGAQDDAFPAHDVKADRAVLEKILQVRALVAEFIFHSLFGGNVLKVVDGSLDSAAVIFQRANIDKDDDARAVRPFDHDFSIPGLGAGPHRICHRAFVVRKGCTVQAKQAMGSAEAILWLFHGGPPPPELCGFTIEANKPAIMIANIDPPGN